MVKWLERLAVVRKVAGSSSAQVKRTVCRKSMDSVDIVRLEYWNAGPWTMSTESMDNVHSVHGHCPPSPWTMSTESMDNVHSVHGLFP